MAKYPILEDPDVLKLYEAFPKGKTCIYWKDSWKYHPHSCPGEKSIRKKGRRIFKGQIVKFSGEDIYILLVSKRWEFAGKKPYLTLVKRGAKKG